MHGWACVALFAAMRDALDAFRRQVRDAEASGGKVPPDLSMQAVSNLAWAFSIFSHIHSETSCVALAFLWKWGCTVSSQRELFDTLSGRERDDGARYAVPVESRLVMHWVQLLALVNTAKRENAALYSKLMEAHADTHHFQRTRELAESERASAKTSKLQVAVSERLRDVGWRHSSEVFVENAGILVDCLGRDNVVVEIDGPVHYTCAVSTLQDTQRVLRKDRRGDVAVRLRLNGTTRKRHEQLRAAGFRVVTVPFYEWNALSVLNSEPRARWRAECAYLDNKLKRARAQGYPKPLGEWEFVVGVDLDRSIDMIPESAESGSFFDEEELPQVTNQSYVKQILLKFNERKRLEPLRRPPRP